jgi:hypothetical protein
MYAVITSDEGEHAKKIARGDLRTRNGGMREADISTRVQHYIEPAASGIAGGSIAMNGGQNTTLSRNGREGIMESVDGGWMLRPDRLGRTWDNSVIHPAVCR